MTRPKPVAHNARSTNRISLVMSKTIRCLLLFMFTSFAMAEESVQVMVLGSYHMGNPGQDVHNIQAADVTTDARQTQLAAVATAVAAFGPTAVAVERVTEAPGYRDPGYEAFDPVQLRDNPNERVQVGYRLAHQSRLEVVYGIDEQPVEGEPDYFPYGKLQKHVADTGQEAAFSEMGATIGRELGEFEARQATESIAELLIVANQVLSNASFYYKMLSFDVGEAQPGGADRLLLHAQRQDLLEAHRCDRARRPGGGRLRCRPQALAGAFHPQHARFRAGRPHPLPAARRAASARF